VAHRVLPRVEPVKLSVKLVKLLSVKNSFTMAVVVIMVLAVMLRMSVIPTTVRHRRERVVTVRHLRERAATSGIIVITIRGILTSATTGACSPILLMVECSIHLDTIHHNNNNIHNHRSSSDHRAI